MEEGVNDGSSLDQQQNLGLYNAVRYGDVSDLQALIDEGVDVSQWRNGMRENLMHYARTVEIAKLLDTHAPDLVNTPDQGGWIPFHTKATLYISSGVVGDFELVAFLCERTSDLDIEGEFSGSVLKTSLRSSERDFGGGTYGVDSEKNKRRNEVFRLLAEKKDFLSEKNVDFDKLAMAVHHNYFEELKVLIERRGNVNCFREDGGSLLHVLVGTMDLTSTSQKLPDYGPMFSYLVSKGVDPQGKDSSGRRPIDLATESPRVRNLVQSWLDSGPEVGSVVESAQEEEGGDAMGSVPESPQREGGDDMGRMLELALNEHGAARKAYEQVKAEFERAREKLDSAKVELTKAETKLRVLQRASWEV